MKRANHPNVLKVKKEIERVNEGDTLLVMEYYDESLQQFLRRKLRNKSFIPPDTILSLFKQLVSGIIHLHSIGIVHRDMKVLLF